MSGALKRDEWETTKWYSLKDLSVTKLEYGSGASAIPYDEDVRYLRITDIAVDGSLTEDFVSPNVYDSKYLLKEDDLLFARTGATVGKTLLFKEKYGKCIYAGFLIRLVPNKDLVVPEYLYYFTKSPRYLAFVQKSMKVVAQPNINAKQYGDLKIPLPPLDVQRRIADTLDKVTELITLRKTQLKKLDELVKARFVELFGHQSHNEKNMPYGKIDDVAEIYLGLTHTPTYVENGVKFISAKNTSCDYLDLSDVKYISREEFEKAPKGTKPQIGDVLFSRVGSNLGHPVILDVDEELCTFVSLGFLRTKGQVTNVYLKHWMRDDFFAEQVAQKVVGGGQPNLNTGWLKEFKIIIPPMALQNEFTIFVEQTDKSKVIIQQSLDTLETLKKSLMQEYFG